MLRRRCRRASGVCVGMKGGETETSRETDRDSDRQIETAPARARISPVKGSLAPANGNSADAALELMHLNLCTQAITVLPRPSTVRGTWGTALAGPLCGDASAAAACTGRAGTCRTDRRRTPAPRPCHLSPLRQPAGLRNRSDTPATILTQ